MIVAAVADRKFRMAGGAQPLILLPVSVNHEPAREFILDTGAGTTLVTPEFAHHLKVEITGSKEGHTAGGILAVQMGRVNSVTVGDAQRDNIDVAITDLSHLSRAIDASVHGDLGYNFLKYFRLFLDFRLNEFRLDEPNRVDYFGPAAITNLPIRLAHPSKPLILADVSVNDGGPYAFAIDTGTSTTVISSELAQELHVITKPISPVTTGSSHVEAAGANLSSLRIGQAAQNDLDVIVAGFLGMLSSVIGTKLDGVIGYNFLRHYKVAIDYPGEMLSLFTA